MASPKPTATRRYRQRIAIIPTSRQLISNSWLLQLLTVLLAVVPTSKGDSVLFQSNEYATGILGDAPFQSYFSSDYTPVAWNFVVPRNRSSASSTPGYLFMAPRGSSVAQYGAVIYDESGQMVWNGNQYGEAMSFGVATYLGEPHILMWSGTWRSGNVGIGYGYNILLNSAYEVVANYTTDLNGETGKTLSDFHETQVTPENNGLMVAYQDKSMDLSSYNNGPSSGWILDSVAQEVNITSGQAIWTWKSSDHVDPSECYPLQAGVGGDVQNAWDYFHINSVEKDKEGNYLISSRHCSTVYYVAGSDGHIIWRLGGSKPSFEMGNGTQFSFQHDARWITKDEKNATLSLFDNAGMYGVYNEDTARGLILRLDFEEMKASLVQQFVPFSPAVSESQGSIQMQANGNVLIGWGQNPWLAEYTSSGELIWTAQFGFKDVQNYRSLRYDWTGLPKTSPSVEMFRGKSSILSFYASWNGATQISKWEVLGATSAEGSGAVSLYNRTKGGFETAITIGATNVEKYSHFAVRAIDKQNQPLGRSEFQQLSNGALQGRLNRFGRVTMMMLVVGAGWVLPWSI